MTGTSLIYTWSHSLSSSPYSTWITVFDAYNHAFLEGLQYDLDRVLAELPLVDPVLVARLRQSFMIRTLWRTPQAMQSLSIYVLIFHSHEADLLEQYDVSSEDQLLQLLFPASVTNGAQRAFLQMALRFVRDPNRPGLDHIIDELSLMGAPSPPTPLAIYFQELSNPHFNRSRAYSRMALSLCEHQLRHHRVPFPFPKVLPQIDFMMEIISRFMPEPQAFVALSLEQQLTQMISVSASLADGALSSNLIIVVAAVIFEIADDDVNVALAVLCRLVSQRFIFCDQRVHPFLHDAFCKVVLRLRACSAQFVDIFQRMVMILLNNQCVRDRIWSEMSSPLYPGPLSRIMHLLMESVEVEMLPMIYLQCPESPIHRALFPLDVEKFCLEVLQYRLDRALESQSKSGLRLANIQDLVENRHATCSVCMQDNVTADQQRQISARGRTPSVMTPCNHCFHTFCLKIWLLQHRNCPICRAAIDIPTYRCSMPDLAISELEIVAALSRLQL